ncbi:hypothetical protein [Parafilimonas terrae]|uniref:Lipoprotein n=1 Tax=Parafilimonas terrae TaxID=1465490 RepID=A0A1I5UBB4_9BACT|nr:hypothetical protein [Parafilimonas terrae]SFP92554.1 hypothetical protein SAMN05444277_103183 [Parafilimonas terrae]
MKQLHYLVICILILSCSKNHSANKLKENAKKQSEDIDIINDLLSKHPNAVLWDSLNGDFSIDYYPALNSSFQIISDVSIDDIYIKDSSYYVLAQSGIEPIFYFTLKVNDNLKNLFDSRRGDLKLKKIFIVTHLFGIKKGFDIEYLGYDPDSNHDFTSEETFFRATGDLIDIKTIE